MIERESSFDFLESAERRLGGQLWNLQVFIDDFVVTGYHSLQLYPLLFCKNDTGPQNFPLIDI